MDEQFDFRALLLKLQDHLSDNDRRRLHFIVGDTIPRQLRDDPTLGGTLNLLETLFDQAKINEQDFDYLIQVFREIHCYEGVKRLQEYQMIKHGRNSRSEETVLEVIDDNEIDRIAINNSSSISVLTDHIEQGTFKSIFADKKNDDHIESGPISITAIKSHKKIVHINLTFIKQTIKSRLTICQLALLLLNIISILILIIIFTVLRRNSCNHEEKTLERFFIIREGLFYGESLGGDPFDDAAKYSLTINEKLVGVKATWSFDTLTTITFIYSNGVTATHGTGDNTRSSLFTGEMILKAKESFTGVVLYKGIRDILNPYQTNGTSIIVGLQFYKAQNQKGELFGSANGTQYSEILSNYKLAFVKGQSHGFIDGLQFVWSRSRPHTKTALISKISN